MKKTKKAQSQRLPETTINALKILVRSYYDYQDERLAMDGRLGITKSCEVKKGVPVRDEALLAAMFKRRSEIIAFEEAMEKEIGKAVKQLPIWRDFFLNVKGCGPVMAAVCVTEFDINKAKAVSNMWSFAGLAPGKDRLVKGQKCCFNQFLRAKLCGVLGSSFLRANSPYRKFYDDMKHRLESANWGTKSKNPTDKDRPQAGHQHKAATRYMIKMFLRDLYVAWRTAEGLEVRPPYQEQYLNHKHAS